MSSAFTIVELIVVISVIAILAVIGIVSYGGWRHSISTTQVQSDLKAVAAAMESARSFSNAYPASLPSTFAPSDGVEVSMYSASSTDYCIDGVSSASDTIQYYITPELNDQGAVEGTCATRVMSDPPAVPSNLVVTSSVGAAVGLTWMASSGAVTYVAQCASDPAFIYSKKEATTALTAATVGGLTPSSSFYCRVKAVNSAGSSSWSASVNTATDNSYGSLAVATSIEGYWTTPPQGFLLEDGSAVSRTIYADLFAVIGTTYGAGNGTTTFNLPDSRGRTSVNQSSDVEFTAIGQKTGSKTEQLTIAQMPSHTHIQNPHDHSNGGSALYYNGTAANGNWTTGGNGLMGGRATAITATTAINQNMGGDGTHNNIQPSIARSFAIKYSPSSGIDSILPAGTSIAGYWSTVPSGYLEENGAAVSRTTYVDLYSAIGTAHGSGNGSTTFNVPDSRGRTTVNKSASDSEFDVLGEKYGEKQHILTIAQMPSHTHIQNPHDHSNGGSALYYNGTAANGNWTTGGNNLIGGQVVSTTATNQNTGGDGAHNNIQPSITKKYAIKHTPAVGSDPAIGTGTSLAGYWTSAPTGYLLEDGAAISRTTYATLFSAIGTTHGVGDGSTTFNLPNSQGRLSVNRNSSDTQFDIMGEKVGAKTQTLTIAEMPSHTHIQNSHDHSNGGNALYYGTGGNGNWTTGGNNLMGGQIVSVTATNQNTGGGAAHNNIQPSIVKLFVIKY